MLDCQVKASFMKRGSPGVIGRWVLSFGSCHPLLDSLIFNPYLAHQSIVAKSLILLLDGAQRFLQKSSSNHDHAFGWRSVLATRKILLDQWLFNEGPSNAQVELKRDWDCSMCVHVASLRKAPSYLFMVFKDNCFRFVDSLFLFGDNLFQFGDNLF